MRRRRAVRRTASSRTSTTCGPCARGPCARSAGSRPWGERGFDPYRGECYPTPRHGSRARRRYSVWAQPSCRASRLAARPPRAGWRPRRPAGARLASGAMSQGVPTGFEERLDGQLRGATARSSWGRPPWSIRSCGGCSRAATCCSRARPASGRRCWCKTLASCLELDFSRIQFTPDLMPSDVTGTNVLVTVARRRAQFFSAAQGAALRAGHAGRRDQPRDPQDAERAAGGDAGARVHDRGEAPRDGGAVLRARDGEPDRDGRDVPAAGSAARSLPAQGRRAEPDRGRDDRDLEPNDRPRSRRRAARAVARRGPGAPHAVPRRGRGGADPSVRVEARAGERSGDPGRAGSRAARAAVRRGGARRAVAGARGEGRGDARRARARGVQRRPARRAACPAAPAHPLVRGRGRRDHDGSSG
jgi:hypothetical protein